jgi:prepilin-type processing-associated H-X9-DG protein
MGLNSLFRPFSCPSAIPSSRSTQTLSRLGCAQYGVWVELPASFHDGACTFAFADGHVELHPWLYDLTKRPVKLNSLPEINFPSSARDDYQWVLDRTTVAPSKLTVVRGASNQVQITWSQLPTNYVMQAIEQLSSGTWTNAGLAPERTVGRSAVRIPVEGGQRFFRLAR